MRYSPEAPLKLLKLRSTSHSSRCHWPAWSHHAPLERQGPLAWITNAFTPLKITVAGTAPRSCSIDLISPCLRVRGPQRARFWLSGVVVRGPQRARFWLSGVVVSVADVVLHSTQAVNGGRNQRITSCGAGVPGTPDVGVTG